MVSTLTWASAASGIFSTATSWTPTGSPSANVAELINATGTNYTVSVGSAATNKLYVGGYVTVNSGNATLTWVSTNRLTSYDVTLLNGTISMVSGGDLVLSAAASVTNSGGLSVTGGTFQETGGTVTVQSLASFTGGTNTISGGLFNAGTLLVGGGGTFLTLNGGTIDQGASLNGSVNLLGTLAIASGGGDIHASSITGTGTIAIAPSATGTIDSTTIGSSVAIQLGSSSVLDYGSAAALVAGESATVYGLIAGGSPGTPRNDIIVTGATGLTGATYSAGTITLTGGTLNGDTIKLSTSAYTPTTIAETAGGNEIFLYDSAVCFAAGTAILTDRGEVPVESLTEGDRVVTMDRTATDTSEVRWVGRRHLDLTSHPHAQHAAPVRIRRGAFAENQPRRDLLVSPDHCLFVGGKLIPAKLLINGMTIVQETATTAVTYFHVELDRHAVLLAEGLPAESYLDTGNRAFFSNAGLALILHPEFHVNAGLRCWDTDACAPLAVSEAAVRPTWNTLAARAQTLGFEQPEVITTDDADLHIVAAGRTFRPVSSNANRFVFVLPAGIAQAHLLSRAGSPADINPWLEDHRKLGVAVSRIVVRGGTEYVEVPVDHPALRQGWHAVETKGRAMWRWTNGSAALPIEASGGPVTIEVHLRSAGTYLVATAETARRLAA